MNETEARCDAAAGPLEAGASALAAFAKTLSEAEWQTRLPKDGRKIGVVVHHVASVYLVEIHLASLLASGQLIAGVSWDAIHTMNSDHAKGNDGATKSDTLALLAKNSATTATAIRAFTDDELDRAAPVSLNSDAPLTLPIHDRGPCGTAQSSPSRRDPGSACPVGRPMNKELKLLAVLAHPDDESLGFGVTFAK